MKRTRKMAYIALMAVFIAVCSQICVPALVPFTLQTFAIFCVLELLGGRYGVMTVLLYIGMGSVGMPVFYGMRGGLSVLMGATGGYITGFAVSTVIYLILEKRVHKKLLWCIWLISDYIFGTLWFALVYAPDGGIMSALITCVVPFIIPDILKMLLAYAFASRLKKIMKAL